MPCRLITLAAILSLTTLAGRSAGAFPTSTQGTTAITFIDSGQRLGQGVSFSPILGDLDGDIDLDLFVTNYWTANKVWMNDGSGYFTNSSRSFGSTSSHGVALGDMDGDSDLDVIVSRLQGYEPTSVYFNVTPSAGVGGCGALPSTHLLGQNRPNPFGPCTEISYRVPSAGHASLKIFDVQGRELRTLVSQFHAAGTYSINFNGRDLPGGTYFCRLEVRDSSGNQVVETRKMMCTR